LKPLEQRSLLEKNDMQQLFSNVEQLVNVNQEIMAGFTKNNEMIGESFMGVVCR
jgi:hypothetical protein